MAMTTYSTLCDPNHSGMELCEEFINEMLLAMVFGIATLPTEYSAKLYMCCSKLCIH